MQGGKNRGSKSLKLVKTELIPTPAKSPLAEGRRKLRNPNLPSQPACNSERAVFYLSTSLLLRQHFHSLNPFPVTNGKIPTLHSGKVLNRSYLGAQRR